MNEPKVLPSNNANRSITYINMQWLGQRVRRAEEIKKLILANDYFIESESVALAMLNLKH